MKKNRVEKTKPCTRTVNRVHWPHILTFRILCAIQSFLFVPQHIIQLRLYAERNVYPRVDLSVFFSKYIDVWRCAYCSLFLSFSPTHTSALQCMIHATHSAILHAHSCSCSLPMASIRVCASIWVYYAGRGSHLLSAIVLLYSTKMHAQCSYYDNISSACVQCACVLYSCLLAFQQRISIMPSKSYWSKTGGYECEGLIIPNLKYTHRQTIWSLAIRLIYWQQ